MTKINKKTLFIVLSLHFITAKCRGREQTLIKYCFLDIFSWVFKGMLQYRLDYKLFPRTWFIADISSCVIGFSINPGTGGTRSKLRSSFTLNFKSLRILLISMSHCFWSKQIKKYFQFLFLQLNKLFLTLKETNEILYLYTI